MLPVMVYFKYTITFVKKVKLTSVYIIILVLLLLLLFFMNLKYYKISQLVP